MKKFCIVLIICMVIVGMAGCGSNYDPEVDRDIQLTTSSTYTDVKEMSTEVTEISKSVEEIKDSINNSSQEEIEKYKKKAESLQKQLDKVTEEKEAIEKSKTPKYQEYIDSVFPRDGTWVLREGSEVQFYSDVTCTNEIKTPKFASSTVNDSAIDKNNRRPHSLRTTDDRIVYCVDWPDLVDESNN